MPEFSQDRAKTRIHPAAGLAVQQKTPGNGVGIAAGRPRSRLAQQPQVAPFPSLPPCPSGPIPGGACTAAASASLCSSRPAVTCAADSPSRGSACTEAGRTHGRRGIHRAWRRAGPARSPACPAAAAPGGLGNSMLHLAIHVTGMHLSYGALEGESFQPGKSLHSYMYRSAFSPCWTAEECSSSGCAHTRFWLPVHYDLSAWCRMG